MNEKSILSDYLAQIDHISGRLSVVHEVPDYLKRARRLNQRRVDPHRATWYDSIYTLFWKKHGFPAYRPTLTVVFSRSMDTCIIKVDGTPYFVCDQNLGDAFNELNELQHGHFDIGRLRTFLYQYTTDKLATLGLFSAALIFADTLHTLKPPSLDRRNLLLVTYIQESFILAHECSHLLLYYDFSARDRWLAHARSLIHFAIKNRPDLISRGTEHLRGVAEQHLQHVFPSPAAAQLFSYNVMDISSDEPFIHEVASDALALQFVWQLFHRRARPDEIIRAIMTGLAHRRALSALDVRIAQSFTQDATLPYWETHLGRIECRIACVLYYATVAEEFAVNEEVVQALSQDLARHNSLIFEQFAYKFPAWIEEGIGPDIDQLSRNQITPFVKTLLVKHASSELPQLVNRLSDWAPT